MIGPEGTDNCHKFVDILGLRTVFPLFMKTPKKMKKTGTSEKDHEGQYLRRNLLWDRQKSHGCVWVWFVVICCFPFPTGALNSLLLLWPVNLLSPSKNPSSSLELFLSLWWKLGGTDENQRKLV